jgi:hypothetical protein
VTANSPDALYWSVSLLGGNLIPLLSQKNLCCQEIQLKLLMIVYWTEIVANITVKFAFISFCRVLLRDAVVWLIEFHSNIVFLLCVYGSINGATCSSLYGVKW